TPAGDADRAIGEVGVVADKSQLGRHANRHHSQGLAERQIVLVGYRQGESGTANVGPSPRDHTRGGVQTELVRPTVEAKPVWLPSARDGGAVVVKGVLCGGQHRGAGDLQREDPNVGAAAHRVRAVRERVVEVEVTGNRGGSAQHAGG